MEKLITRFDNFTNRFDKLFEVVPGGIFGLLSVIIGVSGDIIASIFFPGYNIAENMISDLGRGPGAIFYNVGVIIAGLVAIPFGFYLGNSLNSEEVKDGTVRLMMLCYFISAIALSLSGVFPGIESKNLILFLHGLFAFISFICAALYLAVFGLLVLRDDRYFDGLAYFGFIVVVLLIIVVLTWLPLIEWIANFGIIFWTIFIALYFLQKENKET